MCGNCGAPLAGEFCAACGQKRLTPRDRSLAHLLTEAFHQLTEIDGKLLRSLRLLLFRPGVLSREYMDDRRVRYATPLSLFLLANVLYFFSPALTDFNLPFVNQVPARIALQALDPADPDAAGNRRYFAQARGQAHTPWTLPIVERMHAERQARTPGYSWRQLAAEYDREASIVGKVLIIVHVPVMALALALVYWRRRRYFVEHFVVALHIFTFLLVFGQLIGAPLRWLTERVPALDGPPFDSVLKPLMTLLVFGYLLLACRNAYRCGWGAAVAGFVAVLFGLLLANLWLYRALQFLITLALI